MTVSFVLYFYNNFGYLGIPTYVNVQTPDSKTPENIKAIEDISRKLQKYQEKHHKHQQEYQQHQQKYQKQQQEYQQKYQQQQQEYQQKEAKYTQKLEQIQIQLNEMRSQPDNREIKGEVNVSFHHDRGSSD